MKRLLQVFPLASVILFFMGAVSVLGDDRPAESVALLRRARQLEELRTEASAPFLLRAQIKAAFGKKEIPGEYKLVWEAPNRWREELVLADFKRIRVGVEGGYRQVRSWEFQPQVIFDLDKMWYRFVLC